MFSGSVILTDLNDYIAPSQTCIMPVEVKKTSTETGSTAIKIGDTGDYYEVSQDGVETKLERAAITLNDCLACSGCITSAESILVTMQSHKELYKVLENNVEAIQNGKTTKTVVVSIAPQSRAAFAAKYGLSPLQIARRLTYFLKSLGVQYVFDTSFALDFSLLESAREFVERYRDYQAYALQSTTADSAEINAKHARRSGAEAGNNAMNKARLPMLASSCPGWICYAEKTHDAILPYISETKSPQQIMGSVVKDYLACQLGLRPDDIYHMTVMMCYDKKLEASRKDFFIDAYQTRDVDCVITTGELERMLEEKNFDLKMSRETSMDTFTKMSSDGNLLRTSGSATGGYLEYILQTAARELFGLVGIDAEKEEGVVVKIGRNKDLREVTLMVDGKPALKFASAYGFRNIQNLVRKIKTGASPYHYVEVMACPSGCINGGGQLKSNDETLSVKEWIARVDAVYRSVAAVPPDENQSVDNLHKEWLDDSNPEKVRKFLRTQYHALTNSTTSPLRIEW